MPFANNDDVRIRFDVDGAGPPLVLHIGFVGALEDLVDAGYVAALRDRFRLVLLDPRGQGQSDKPHDATAYTVDRRAGDVLAVLDALEIERAHFWGYSLGGWIGFALGALAPTRVGALVIGGAHPFQGNPRSMENDWLLGGLRRGMAALVAEWEADVPDFWVSRGERARWLAADADALVAARLNNLTEPDLPEAAIAGISAPTLLYAGTGDEPDPVRRAAQIMPNASFVALDGLDHAQGFARLELILPHVQTFLARADVSALTTSP
ncbi:MAG: alpha/beta fold hydrolase [Thermomicrobiales bacterium]